MKLLLLKALLLRKGKDEGFTLPIVIAIGLVMVLLSAVNLVQSGEENLNALSQQGSSDALAMAEIGVARYRDLLNNNRVLAVNDLGTWTAFNNETCEPITDTGGGWADNDDTTGWRPINVAGNNLGSYRIVDYQYDQNPLDGDFTDDNDFDQVADANNDFSTPPDGESDAAGQLTVRGQDATGSIAQLQVTIPIGINNQEFQDIAPALWIQQPNSTSDPYITNFGDVNVNGANVVLSRPSGSGDCDPITTSSSILNAQNAISNGSNLPPLITDTAITSFTKRSLLTDITSQVDSTVPRPNPYPANFYDTTNNEIVLGTTLDDATALHTDGGYYYTTGTSNLEIDAEESVIADGNARVILHVGGDLVIDTGTAGDTTTIANAQLGFLANDIGRYLEIHVENNVTISGTGTLNMSGLLRVGGTVNITEDSTVNLTGAIWANQWNNNGGATVNITLDDHMFYSGTPNRTPAPLTFRPSGWQTQEAN